MKTNSNTIVRGIGLLDAEAWGLLASFYRGRSAGFVRFFGAASVQALLLLPPLYIVRLAFDVAIPKGDSGLLIWLGVALFGSRLLAGGAALATRSAGLGITRSATAELRSDLVGTLLGLSREFHSFNDTDRLHSRIVEDCERIDNVSSNLISLVPVGLAAIALTAGLLWLNWELAALLAVVGPVMWSVFARSGRSTKRAVRTFQAAFENVSKNTRFLLSNIDLVRLFGFEDGESKRQVSGVEQLRDTGKTMAMAFARHGQIQASLTGLSAVIMLVGGGLEIQRGAMSLGSFLAFYVAANMLTGCIDRILAAMPDLIVGNESLASILRIRRAGPREPYAGTAIHRVSGNISVRRVSFGRAGHPLLRDITFDLRPGTMIAVVGANGCGKTTLVNLILGFYRPDSGEIFADSVPYDSLDMRALRRSMGVVPQQPLFFTGTIMANIGYGRPNLEPEKVRAAAKLADADRYIRTLPQGYDTSIGEGGVPLSRGEAQRLAIARALLGDPKVLVLDEPTNHLDTASMQRIMRGLGERRERPAILIVSHDSAIVRLADEIFRIESGRLVLEKARASRGMAL